ncbi:LGFP repeat-containing protein [Dietzia sp. ANT_WB102]|uniref:LGFP repeat-containing protein n=1 Tax=Dietzia sp. ANT_WB102 TaxID=2597345 RepID=UPI0011EE9E1D|nr:hypothetical protein [Dietzia sp. ANT_WB102]KAA0919385.1 hypothetical protein FQ137_09120 [Dietzia sp. ANT_WB102]
MDRLTRALAPLALATVLGASLIACSGEGSGGTGETAAPATSEERVTTNSTPVPGPADSAINIPVAVADRWDKLGGEKSDLGRVTGPVTVVEGGSITDFERGSIVLTPSGRAFVVQGEILTSYLEAGGPAGALGFPTADEATTDGGWISVFENGTIAYLDGQPVVEIR